MSWRDGLRRVTLPDGRKLIGASFRGVAFFVESSDRAGGRRIVTHEFPRRDEPFVEDLGRRARALQVEAYLVGDDYLQQRDALLAALEDEAGPGELVHPYHGVRRAICSSLTVRETRTDGGLARFQITFNETSAEAPAPTQQPDHAELVEQSADRALLATEAALVEDYHVDGEPSFALSSLSKELAAASRALADALGPVADSIQEAAKLNAEVNLLALEAASLVRRPTAMMAALRSTLGALADTSRSAPRTVLSALLETYDTIGVVSIAIGATATRERERHNQAALAAMLGRVLVVEAARLAPRVSYQTLEDATTDSAAIADRLEDQAADASATAYPALVTLRARVRRAVPGDAILARILDVERRVAVPSLVLSYELYGSVDLEADIVARNRIRHPGFVTGSLQVLSRG